MLPNARRLMRKVRYRGWAWRSLEFHRGRGDLGRERKGSKEEEAILGREIAWAKA